MYSPCARSNVDAIQDSRRKRKKERIGYRYDTNDALMSCKRHSDLQSGLLLVVVLFIKARSEWTPYKTRTCLSSDDELETVEPSSAGTGYAANSVAARRDERVPVQVSKESILIQSEPTRCRHEHCRTTRSYDQG